MNNYGFPFHHSFHYLPTAVVAMYAHWYRTLAVSMAGTYNGHRKTVSFSMLSQHLLTSLFLVRIFPIGIL